jgi:hypothetical protein
MSDLFFGVDGVAAHAYFRYLETLSGETKYYSSWAQPDLSGTFYEFDVVALSQEELTAPSPSDSGTAGSLGYALAYSPSATAGSYTPTGSDVDLSSYLTAISSLTYTASTKEAITVPTVTKSTLTYNTDLVNLTTPVLPKAFKGLQPLVNSLYDVMEKILGAPDVVGDVIASLVQKGINSVEQGLEDVQSFTSNIHDVIMDGIEESLNKLNLSVKGVTNIIIDTLQDYPGKILEYLLALPSVTGLSGKLDDLLVWFESRGKDFTVKIGNKRDDLLLWLNSSISVSLTGTIDIQPFLQDVIDAVNDGFDTFSGLLATKLDFTTTVPTPLNVPSMLNITFSGDLAGLPAIALDWYDVLISTFLMDTTPSQTMLTFLPFNIGVATYFVVKNDKVPGSTYFPQSGSPTQFGGFTDGFSYKDVLWDITKPWAIIKLLGFLGRSTVENIIRATVGGASDHFTKKAMKLRFDNIDNTLSSIDGKADDILTNLSTQTSDIANLTTLIEELTSLIGLSRSF